MKSLRLIAESAHYKWLQKTSQFPYLESLSNIEYELMAAAVAREVKRRQKEKRK